MAAREEEERDLLWDVMVTVAQRMERKYRGTTRWVGADSRRSWRRLTVVQGLYVGGPGLEAFFPVRARSLLGSRWREVQPVQRAASQAGALLRDG